MPSITIPFLATTTAMPATSKSSQSAADPSSVDPAFAALKTYDAGSDRAALMPIDDAVRACLGQPNLRRALERRLISVLRDKASPLAKEYVCSRLELMGGPDSVPTLAALLVDRDLAHAARRTLEAMPCPEAATALRRGLAKTRGAQRVGVINSLGARRGARSVSALAGLLNDPDPAVVCAAAAALGNIGTNQAGKALRKFLPSAIPTVQRDVADACLVCAEWLSNNGETAEAQAIYRLLTDARQTALVRQAAERGLSHATRRR